MARPIKNPGVGRGRGPRETKEVQCGDCGKGFPAARSDAKRCPECKLANDAQRKNVARLAAGRRVGVGRGAGARQPRTFRCVTCDAVFSAARKDALYCEDCGRRREATAYEERERTVCACGNFKSRRGKRCRSCMGKWRSETFRGPTHPSWKGGHTRHQAGYIFILDPRPNPKHHYVAEHRFMWEIANGPIPAGHIIHHINGNKSDNRLENFACLSQSEHQHLHSNPDSERSAHIQSLEAELQEARARIRELEST